MENIERKTIEISEICRVEGHSAVAVDIQDRKVIDVRLDVFEGTRFFERIVLGHKYDEIPHITSRVCAICSTGHVLAAIHAVERIFDYVVSDQVKLYRELMHLGMIIESHATHICALALPDFLGTPDLVDFATKHEREFDIWTRLRKLGAAIQTIVGGRPFHPVNLHVGGLSRYPDKGELTSLSDDLLQSKDLALHLCNLLMSIKLPVKKTVETAYLALIPEGSTYGFFGDQVLSSDGWTAGIDEYQNYLAESVVPYSHAKQSRLSLNVGGVSGKPFMVGSMARLALFGHRLGKTAASVYQDSSLSQGDKNTILNNLAQAIEIVEAIDLAQECIRRLQQYAASDASKELKKVTAKAGKCAGAVECPRGTLYHFYELDEDGWIKTADMITPSAQNTARIELDIKTVVEEQLPVIDKKPASARSKQAKDTTGSVEADSSEANETSDALQANLETLVRAYDPCNTCATHTVQIRYGKERNN